MLAIQNAYADYQSIAPTPPSITDSQGNVLSRGIQEELVIISTDVYNNQDKYTPFVVFIEARDENDVTQYLQFQIGAANPNDHIKVGISWTPEQAGNYQLRTFLIKSFTDPILLSAIYTSSIVIE